MYHFLKKTKVILQSHQSKIQQNLQMPSIVLFQHLYYLCSQRWIQTFRHSQKNQSSQNKRLLSSNNSLIRHFVEHSVYKVQLVVKVTLKNLRANVLQNFANYQVIIEFWSIFTLNMYFSNIYWQYLSLWNIQIVKLA